MKRPSLPLRSCSFAFLAVAWLGEERAMASPATAPPATRATRAMMRALRFMAASLGGKWVVARQDAATSAVLPALRAGLGAQEPDHGQEHEQRHEHGAGHAPLADRLDRGD